MSRVEVRDYLCKHPEVLNNRKQLIAVVKDGYAANPAQVTQLSSVLDFGFIEKITSRQLLNTPISKGPAVNQVRMLTGYSEEIAKWVVDAWLSFIDEKVIEAYEKNQKNLARTEIKNEPQREVKPQNTASSEGFSLIELCQKPFNNSSPIFSREFYFPSGNSNDDTGFFVRGIKEAEDCLNKFAQVYAVILGFLQRKLLMTESAFLKEYFKKIHKDLDFSRVFRYEVLLLVMIKNNYFAHQEIDVQYDRKDEDEIRAAIADINHYADLLCKLFHSPYEDLVLSEGRRNSVSVSIGQGREIYTEDLKSKRIGQSRYLWYEPNIIFEIEETDRGICEELLRDLLGFSSFRPGQFEAIAAILNGNEHKVCVMPTGAGKSLIFYFVALLHSRPTFIVTPTDILIEDQIRNLKEYHGIDDAIRIKSADKLLEFYPTNKLMYLTADTFMNRDLILRLIRLNHKKMIGNVVLDEVHCISNWSHDFRPEYLMLSNNLKEFVDKTGYLCFTATANYTVMKDIMYQLNLNAEQILSFEQLTSGRRRYHFVSANSLEEVREKAAKQAAAKIKFGARTICFAKTSRAAQEVFDELPEEIQDMTDLYLCGRGRQAYSEFSQGKMNGLVADRDVGIGVNFPNIQSTLHAGLPISKSQFVQEIGRAGRNGEDADSYVVFQNQASLGNRLLLRRDISTEEIFEALKGNDANDLAETMRLVFDGVIDKKVFGEVLEKFAHDVCHIKNGAHIAVLVDGEKTVRVYMRCLYMLFRMGILWNWYIIDISNPNRAEFYVEVSEEEDLLGFAKERLIEYLRAMGDFGRVIRMIKGASTLDEIRQYYVDWYYDHFLYHHREQVLEMHEFLHHFQMATDDEIAGVLKNYFSLSLLSVKETGDFIKTMTMKDIFEYAGSGADGLAEDVSRSLENEYHRKLDYYLFCYNAARFNSVDADRLSRVAVNCSLEERYDILTALQPRYEEADWMTRLEILNIMCRCYSLEEVTKYLYAQNDDAMVVLTVLCFNQKWGGSYA